MTALATPARSSAPTADERRRPLSRHAAKRRFEPVPGGANLEERMVALWASLGEAGPAECPVCTGELLAGGCRDCGSELS